MNDTSQLVEFQRCQRFYEYRYVHSLEFPVGYSEGSYSKFLVHDPITHWYEHGGIWIPDWDELWKQYVAVVKTPPQWLKLSSAKVIYGKYIQQMADVFEKYTVLHVEKMLPTTIEGFGVKPDVVLVRRSDSSVWPRDIKISKWPKVSVGFDRQFCAQVDATGGVGHIRDFFQLPDPKKPDLLGDWVVDEQLAQMDYLEEWRQETMMALRPLEAARESGVYVKQAPQACQMGRVVCPAMAICQAGGLRWEVIKRWPKVADAEEYQK